MISIKELSGIDEIPPDEWNSIVTENDILKTHAYLRAIEKSGLSGFRYRYLVFYENETIIAHTVITLLSFDIAVLAGGVIKKILGISRKLFPDFLNLKVIETGFSTALGNPFSFRENTDRKIILTYFSYHLNQIAKREKSSILLVRDFNYQESLFFDELFKLGFKKFNNFPDTFFISQYNTFQDYLQSLTSKRRREIQHRMKIFDESGCTIEVVQDFEYLCPILEKLWTNTFRHAKEYQREVLNLNYFTGLSQLPDHASWILLCRRKGEPVGFTLFLETPDTIISTYCGLDYQHNKETYTYFNLFYHSIRIAIEKNKKKLELGITNYNPKIETGAVLETLWIYGKSPNFLINLILVPLLKVINSMPVVPVRSVYNRRLHHRYKADQLSVLIFKNLFPVFDIHESGISILIKDNLPKEIRLHRKTELTIFSGHLSVRGTFKIVNLFQNGDGHKAGLSLIKLPETEKIIWQEIIRRYETDESAV